MRPSLLSPNPHVELSVSRISGLELDEVRELADAVARKRGKEGSLGYGELLAGAARTTSLDVEPDEPPVHHANIAGWPSDSDPDEQRRRQLQVAKALVEQVELILWNSKD